MRTAFRSPSGVTVVEIVVGMAIAGILLALLLPAIQQTRETARSVACRNNLRQVALAAHTHEGAYRHLPTGGWGWRWQGDPDRGFGEAQPGGWIYNVLPFLEASQIHDIGSGLQGAVKAQSLARAAQTPVPIFVCPSRRGPEPLPFVHTIDFVNMARPKVVARSDYAACSGDAAPDFSRGKGRGPGSLGEGDSPSFRWLDAEMTGVVFRRSRVKFADLRGGLSSKYLVGEKYLARADYFTGRAQNDDQNMLVGFDIDTLRTTDPSYPPLADEQTTPSEHSFGSAHPGGFNMAMVDGSVHCISYNIDREAHRVWGNRNR